ncbi:MAG: hypothetical protein LQ342_005994 [Letrouitia transgressa]|nr:MAG: hypothetical protein LQ342_005994 [Letrouitia transgressa]
MSVPNALIILPHISSGQIAPDLQKYKSYLKIPKPTHDLSTPSEWPSPDGGQLVVFHGYLGSNSNLSKNLSFVQLLSKDGKCCLQVVSSRSATRSTGSSAHEKIKSLTTYTPVAVTGLLRHRKQPPHDKSPWIQKIKHVELDLSDVQALNDIPPDIIVKEDMNFPPDQRHLQLRFQSELREAIHFRSKVGILLRNELDKAGFSEIETPLLFKSTSEGAREFIVPTRRKGLAYALPQSPQQFKQILMGSGISRYFQIAKCFRDEDFRADRQPEFTQLDMEIAFGDADEVMKTIELLMQTLWARLLGLELSSPFPRLKYEEAMSKYGSDKPDIRLGMPILRVDYLLPGDLIHKITPLQDPIIEMFALRLGATQANPPTTREFIAAFMDSPQGTPYTQNPAGAPGAFVFDSSRPLQGLSALGFEAAEYIENALSAEDGDLIVFQARRNSAFTGGSTTLGGLRTAIHTAAVKEGLLDPPAGFAPLWVTDFPLFSPVSSAEPAQRGNAGLASTHHPFTSPKTPDDLDLLLTDPRRVTGDHYDLVINGVELGGGSRRIHHAELQEFIMRDILKMSQERIAEFSHLLQVLRVGCPPHAGIALGFDRLVALMLGKESVRDVIAFPKSGKGEDMMVKSPSMVNSETLRMYHLETKN